MEQIPCPCCGGRLNVIGSRRRKYITSLSISKVLVIRRLICVDCKRIHHELPDILVPYKRYASEAIERVVEDESPLFVTVDESTLFRWRHWFTQCAERFAGFLESIRIRYGNGSVEDRSVLPLSVLQRIYHYVGNAPGWLGRVVRTVANSNHWVQTRSAFCPNR